MIERQLKIPLSCLTSHKNLFSKQQKSPKCLPLVLPLVSIKWLFSIWSNLIRWNVLYIFVCLFLVLSAAHSRDNETGNNDTQSRYLDKWQKFYEFEMRLFSSFLTKTCKQYMCVYGSKLTCLQAPKSCKHKQGYAMIIKQHFETYYSRKYELGKIRRNGK